jgi:lipopolysaccharide export system protein LptC
MTARRWLNIINALLIGCVLGWFLRTHSVNDRWMMAKVEKYETETSYWLNKLDNEIQESKGDIQKERTNVKH